VSTPILLVLAVLGAAVLAVAIVRAVESAKRAADLQAQLAAKEQLLARAQQDLAQAQQDRARLGAEVDAERRARAAIKDTFAAVSAEALKDNNEAFLQLAKATLEKTQAAALVDLSARQNAISELVQPLKDTLTRIGDRVQQVDTGVATQLRAVSDTQERLRRETESLVRALRSPNQRGRWGEITLRNILERAGMAAYCGDFVEKDSVEDEHGRRSIPDMTVRLPNGSCVVIDSKVPIDAYLRSLECAEDDQRECLLRDHARQVREHIKGLGAKNYWAKFTPTPELVVMFLPGEPLVSTALQLDPTLFDYAAEQRVIPASPLTLLALLRTIASAWQQQRLAENAEQVRALGTELYERLALMAGYVQNVGLNLRQAASAYDQFIGSLDNRVLVTARRFRDLGITATKDIPDEIPPLHMELREPRALELRVPVQESLIDAEIVVAEAEAVEPT
jgi:DNA recombination protein RmuC